MNSAARNLIALALLCAGTVASAEVLFDASVHPRDRAEIRGVYRRLPKRSRAVDVTVGVTPSPEFCGLYDSDASSISISRYCAPGWTFAHEMGHHTMESGFSDYERRRWEVFWRANLESMPTVNARSTPEEGFAECFRYFYMKRSAVGPAIRREMQALARRRDG